MIYAYQDIKYKGVSVWLLLIGGVFGVALAADSIQSARTNLYEIIIATIPGLLMIVLSILSGQIGPADGLVFVMLGMTSSVITVYQLLVLSCILFIIVNVMLRIVGKKYNQMPFIPFVFSSYTGLIVLNIC